MVTAEVQQVTTHSKAKQSEWDVQEAVRKVGKEWVEEANNNNVTRMLQESNAPNVTSDKSRSRQEEVPIETPDEDEEWKVLTDNHVSLRLIGLLKLEKRDVISLNIGIGGLMSIVFTFRMILVFILIISPSFSFGCSQ